MELKQELFEMIFKAQVMRYRKDSNQSKKLVDVAFTVENESLQNFFYKLYSKYKFKVQESPNDFISECIFQSWEAIKRFHIRDEGNWEMLLAGDDRPNMGRLITSIKRTVEAEIIKYVNDGTKYSTKTENGRKVHTGHNIQFSSLDAFLVSDEGKTKLIETIASDMNYFTEKEDYQLNQFAEWFRDNKTSILTKSQMNLLNNLQNIGFNPLDTRPTDLEQVIGFPAFKLNTNLDRIKKRVMKAWEKELSKGLTETTQLQKEVENELGLWSKLTKLTEDNQAVSEWFIDNLDIPQVESLVYDNLTDDIVEVVKAYRGEQKKISNKVLYKLYSLVEKRIEALESMDTSSMDFYKKEEERGRWTLEAHKQQRKSLKEWKEQPCIQYGPDGHVIGVINYKGEVLHNTVMYQVTPLGMSINTNII